jgi:hypothetical protein
MAQRELFDNCDGIATLPVVASNAWALDGRLQRRVYPAISPV